MTKLTFAYKFSDFFAKVFASWRFVIPFLILLNIWVALNLLGILKTDERLERVNFFISEATLFIDLVIIMTQRRQTEMDRNKLNAILTAEKSDKAAMDRQNIEISVINRKLDTLLAVKK